MSIRVKKYLLFAGKNPLGDEILSWKHRVAALAATGASATLTLRAHFYFSASSSACFSCGYVLAGLKPRKCLMIRASREMTKICGIA